MLISITFVKVDSFIDVKVMMVAVIVVSTMEDRGVVVRGMGSDDGIQAFNLFVVLVVARVVSARVVH